MTKITISVCKVYKNTGSRRSHRDKTKKHWKHYFLEDGKFGTEWVNSIRAQFLKTQKRKLRNYLCVECGFYFRAWVKKPNDECECPQCEN